MPEPQPRNLLHEIKSELAEIEISKINPGNRARKAMGNISELELSIKQQGLIHPIAVMAYEKEFSGYKYFLLAGGRRLEAHKRLKETKIKANIYPPGLSPYEIKSIELEENLKRESLTDAERILLQSEQLATWKALYGEKTSTDPNAPGMSQREAAKKMGMSTGKLSEDLEIAEWIKKVPELGNLTSRADIKRAIEKAKKAVTTQKILTKYENGQDKSTPEIDQLVQSYIVGDFFDKVTQVPDASIQFIDLDIDYPMELDKMHKESKEDREQEVYKTVTKKDFPHLMQATFEQCHRVMSEGFLIVWFGYEYFEKLQTWAKKVGFKTHFYHGKWYKGSGHTRNPYDTLNHTIEPFFYFKKGSPKIQVPHDDVYNFPPVSQSIKRHPFEKPLLLMESIFTTFCPMNSRVLIPFAGAGNSIIAAYHNKCKVIGIDTSKQYRDEFEVFVRENLK